MKKLYFWRVQIGFVRWFQSLQTPAARSLIHLRHTQHRAWFDSQCFHDSSPPFPPPIRLPASKSAARGGGIDHMSILCMSEVGITQREGQTQQPGNSRWLPTGSTFGVHFIYCSPGEGQSSPERRKHLRTRSRVVHLLLLLPPPLLFRHPYVIYQADECRGE